MEPPHHEEDYSSNDEIDDEQDNDLPSFDISLPD
jgi:hypothetical protein